MNPESREEIGAVTVTYNSSGVLPGFLHSLSAATEFALRVVVVDNASDDAATSRQVAAMHGAEFLEMPDNAGYGAAANAAVGTLPDTVAFVLISNPDVRFEPGALDRLLAAAAEWQAGGAFGPRIFDVSGKTYPSARNLPSLRTGIGHALLGTPWPSNPWSRRYQALDADGTHPRTAGWLSGACLLLRTDAFREVSGFDEGYFMYFEDVDLGRRLALAGWKNVFVPDAHVVHSGAHSTSKHAARMIRAHHDSAVRYLDSRYTGAALAPLRFLLRLGLGLRRAVATRAARRSAGG